MIGIVAVASSLAQLIQLPDIVGAFLSGLALNAAVKEKAAKKELEFIGNSLFIPIFFITTGFLIDPRALAHSLATDLAARAVDHRRAGRRQVRRGGDRRVACSGTRRDERLTVWSLTLPQVAATLAATLVAYKTVDRAGSHLLDDRMLNVVIALMFSTSILGPVLTERFAPRLAKRSRPDGGQVDRRARPPDAAGKHPERAASSRASGASRAICTRSPSRLPLVQPERCTAYSADRRGRRRP